MNLSDYIVINLLNFKDPSDSLGSFSCGNTEIDSFLKTKARDWSIVSNTFLLVNKQTDEIVAFYTLSNGLTKLTKKYKKKHEFKFSEITEYPSINIVYFAVAESFQNKGFGKELMLSLLGSIYDHRLEFGGLSFVTVESLPESQSFYRKNFAFDNEESQNTFGNCTLALTLKEIGQLLSNANQ